jgi:hypothetical protein
MKIKIIILSLVMVFPVALFAQFDGIVGSEGCKAIHCDDLRFIEWATACEVIRGYQDIAYPEKGKVSYGTAENAIGKVYESKVVVSLGDSGVAILTFQTPIANGEGYDFAVFENSFSNNFLELAFVEVSSDGVHYFRFPATSNTPTDKQVGTFDTINATRINNLAGKYNEAWGTPLDLEELVEDENLDKNNIRYVKIIDVIGTIEPDYATYDANGNTVNDPYPTAFYPPLVPSGGFDLSGVGVIYNQNNTSVKEYDHQLVVSVYPNPCSDFVYIHAEEGQFCLYNISGQKLTEQQLTENVFRIDMGKYPAGVYFIHLRNHRITKYIKLIKQ